MARIVREAFDAGAAGFSSNRFRAHMSRSGKVVPGTFAAGRRARGRSPAPSARPATACSRPSPTARSPRAPHRRRCPTSTCSPACRSSRGRPLTFSTFQASARVRRVPPGARRRRRLERAGRAAAAADHPAGRHVHDEPRHLPPVHEPADLQGAGRPPARRAGGRACASPRCASRSSASRTCSTGGLGAMMGAMLGQAVGRLFSLDVPGRLRARPVAVDQGPGPGARRRAARPTSTTCMTEGDGTTFFAILGNNFGEGTLEPCREMLLDPQHGERAVRRRRPRDDDLGLLAARRSTSPTGCATAPRASGCRSSWPCTSSPARRPRCTASPTAACSRPGAGPTSTSSTSTTSRSRRRTRAPTCPPAPAASSSRRPATSPRWSAARWCAAHDEDTGARPGRLLRSGQGERLMERPRRRRRRRRHRRPRLGARARPRRPPRHARRARRHADARRRRGRLRVGPPRRAAGAAPARVPRAGPHDPARPVPRRAARRWPSIGIDAAADPQRRAGCQLDEATLAVLAADDDLRMLPVPAHHLRVGHAHAPCWPRRRRARRRPRRRRRRAARRAPTDRPSSPACGSRTARCSPPTSSSPPPAAAATCRRGSTPTASRSPRRSATPASSTSPASTGPPRRVRLRLPGRVRRRPRRRRDRLRRRHLLRSPPSSTATTRSCAPTSATRPGSTPPCALLPELADVVVGRRHADQRRCTA